MNFKLKPATTANKLLCLYPHTQGLALALTQLQQPQSFKVDKVTFIEQLALDKAQLSHLMKKYHLPDWPVNLLLPANQYQLRLIELPEVDEQDMMDAVKLKAADFINFPLEEAIINLIHIPQQAFHGRRKMGYIIISQKSIIEQWVNCIRGAGLTLHAIDIEDMSLRNLSLLQSDKPRNGLVFFNKQSTQISLCFEQDLVLVRKIDIGTESLIQNKQLDPIQKEALILEIQRSFDYFQSQLGLGLVEHLTVLADNEEQTVITPFLQENINCSVNSLSHFSNSNNNVFCTLAIGAGLRYLESEYETTS